MNPESKSFEQVRTSPPGPTQSTYVIDVSSNRQARKWSLSELTGRALWEVLRNPLFKWTPRPLWVWRRVMLRLFGAEIGRDVRIHPTARIAVPWNLRIGDEATIGDQAILYALGSITIGSQVTVSQNAHLCAGTHDYRRSDMPLLKTPITIAEGAWVCADAYVGPGVTVGAFSIVGARAVVLKSIPDGVIVGGNPARILRNRPPTEPS
jgi:putative colanic acid biosynthesis acetyltransferase WcaF